MKKQLTVAALAALAYVGVAQAQNSLTVYGALDAGVLNISNTSGGPAGYFPSNVDAGSLSGFKDGGIGGSNIGLKGERDMGSGKKAYFQLQGNINLKDGVTGGSNATGGTSNFNQMALVGFAGGAGDLKLGRQVSPMYYAMAATDARGARYFGSTLTALVGMNSASGVWIGNNNSMFGTVYNDSSIVYTTPRFANTTISVQHAFGNTGGSSSANSQDAVTALYSSGGLRVSALYYSGKGNGALNAATLVGASNPSLTPTQIATATAGLGFTSTANTNRLTSLAALYTMGDWTMSVGVFEGKNPAAAKLPTPIVSSQNMSMNAFGLAYKMSPEITISGGHYTLKDKTNSGNKASQTALSLDYVIFKDTTAYIQTASTSNTGANMNLSPIYGVVPVAGKSNSATMIGVRYTF